MTYSPIAVANYFIQRALLEGCPADHLKLQKLVYIAHGWALAILGAPLVREGVQAWKYGPVFKTLYHSLKSYGNRKVTEPITRVRGLVLDTPTVDLEDEDTVALLDRVWDVYKAYSGVQLSNLTHQEGTPWAETWATSRGRENVKIHNNLIKGLFRELGSRKARP